MAVVHGQMAEDELEAAMLRFVRGEADVLVATTIIESGLDIPNANTIFINEADIYGLADLHQLRGRVGRYKHRAYCYLLLDGDRRSTPHGGAAAQGDRGIHRARGRASRSPCATWRSAAPATFSARSRAGTSPRSATRCIASFWRTPCAD